MFSSKKVFLVICVALNIVDLNGDKKLWSSSYGPNFDPDFPHFTPFNSDQFINVESDVRAENSQQSEDLISVDNSDDKLDKEYEQSNGEPQYFYSEKSVSSAPADHQFRERIKPLKNFVMGLYKNYRSTYLGNNTMHGLFPEMQEVENKIEDVEAKEETIKTKRKTRKKSKLPNLGNDIKYNVGPGVNVSLDHEKELVNVYLDEDCLKDVFTGTVILYCKEVLRPMYLKFMHYICSLYNIPVICLLYSIPLTGRGKKYDLISKILPLFILPFLIQSAIVPFVVSTLKLLLVKSIVVGKIAIFLLVVSAFKNHGKYGFDAPPAYYVDPPSRRSEASTGYRVEGKPTTWVT